MHACMHALHASTTSPTPTTTTDDRGEGRRTIRTKTGHPSLSGAGVRAGRCWTICTYVHVPIYVNVYIYICISMYTVYLIIVGWTNQLKLELRGLALQAQVTEQSEQITPCHITGKGQNFKPQIAAPTESASLKFRGPSLVLTAVGFESWTHCAVFQISLGKMVQFLSYVLQTGYIYM